MTEIENKQAAKPQSDWDGYIIPRSFNSVPHNFKRYAMDEKRSLRRNHNPSHSQTTKTPNQKLQPQQPRNYQSLRSKQTMLQRIQRVSNRNLRYLHAINRPNMEQTIL